MGSLYFLLAPAVKISAMITSMGATVIPIVNAMDMSMIVSPLGHCNIVTLQLNYTREPDISKPWGQCDGSLDLCRRANV